MSTNNVDEMLKKYDLAISQAEINAKEEKVARMQQDVGMQQDDLNQGIAREQLDVGEILDRVHNLLRGYVLKRNAKTGVMEWIEPVDNDMRILTDYGVNYVMSAVQWYVNKNTLLSNYDELQINDKMKDFAIAIIDDVFMEYDKMFLYPTLEDCKKELDDRIKKKAEIRMYASELIGITADRNEVETQLIKEIEDRVMRELEVIRQQKIKNKLKRFESIMRFVQDTVHSAYQRAWRGQERTTLRQHWNISENKGGGFMQPQNTGYNPFAAFKSK